MASSASTVATVPRPPASISTTCSDVLAVRHIGGLMAGSRQQRIAVIEQALIS